MYQLCTLEPHGLNETDEQSFIKNLRNKYSELLTIQFFIMFVNFLLWALMFQIEGFKFF